MEVVRVSVEPVPPEVIEVGVNVGLTPAGCPDALRVTVWAEPEVIAADTVVAADWPAVTDIDPGLSEMEKSLPVTDSVNVVLWVADVPVPVIVTV